MSYLKLFLLFAKIGVMTFGGGYAMLPILQRELVDTRHWATEEELADYFAIGQCTPGIIAVNTATFIGHKRKGIPGGIVATLGVVFPSLIIITILAGLITTFADLPFVQNAFAGIRVSLFREEGFILAFGIFLVVALAATFLNLSPAIYVLITAALGIILEALHAMPGERGKKA